MEGELSVDINMNFIYWHFFYIKLSTHMTGLTSLLEILRVSFLSFII
jgi:hypothetical protein